MELVFTPLRRPDGVEIEQALARNNSWYLIVPDNAGTYDLRYASQSANSVLGTSLTRDGAKAEAEIHAARYDTRI